MPTEKKPKQVDFPNLKRGFNELKNNVIMELEAVGICFCWEFYDEPRFQDKVVEKQLVCPGDKFQPKTRPGSVKRVPISTEEYDY